MLTPTSSKVFSFDFFSSSRDSDESNSTNSSIAMNESAEQSAAVGANDCLTASSDFENEYPLLGSADLLVSKSVDHLDFLPDAPLKNKTLTYLEIQEAEDIIKSLKDVADIDASLLMEKLNKLREFSCYDNEICRNSYELQGNFLLKATEAGDLNLVENLLNCKSPINYKNKDGETALMVAVENNYGKIAELLLSKRADIFLLTPDCRSAVTIAMKNENDDIFKMLRRHWLFDCDVSEMEEFYYENHPKKDIKNSQIGIPIGLVAYVLLDEIQETFFRNDSSMRSSNGSGDSKLIVELKNLLEINALELWYTDERVNACFLLIKYDNLELFDYFASVVNSCAEYFRTDFFGSGLPDLLFFASIYLSENEGEISPQMLQRIILWDRNFLLVEEDMNIIAPNIALTSNVETLRLLSQAFSFHKFSCPDDPTENEVYSVTALRLYIENKVESAKLLWDIRVEELDGDGAEVFNDWIECAPWRYDNGSVVKFAELLSVLDREMIESIVSDYDAESLIDQLKIFESDDSESFKIFVDLGLSLNQPTTSGSTLAHLAIELGAIKCFEILAKAQADLSIPDDYQLTPLMQAARDGKVEVVEIILSQFNVISSGNAIQALLMLTAVDKNGMTAFNYAKKTDQKDVCAKINDFMADLAERFKSPDEKNKEPIKLDASVDARNHLLSSLVKKSNAGLYVSDCNGVTALMRVAQENDERAAFIILRAYYEDHVGQGALSFRSQLYMQDNFGRTVFDYAQKSDKVLKLLEDAKKVVREKYNGEMEFEPNAQIILRDEAAIYSLSQADEDVLSKLFPDMS